MSPPTPAMSAHHEPHDDIIYPDTVPFLLVHLACLGVLWTGFTTTSVILAISLYVIRMFAITAGFHRYFSHKSFKTSRVGQFLLAFVGQMSAQRGTLWWAAKHRDHHKHSDTPEDVHSPRHMGFFGAHVGWIFQQRNKTADYSRIPDLTRYPELVWLNRHDLLPAFLLAIICVAIDGWAGLFVGFFLSTVVLYHCTFMINSLAHVYGKQRYVTGDDSRNNWLLAVITLGEGWHNNHHHFQASTRQGFRWWEIDITYYILVAMSWVGLVWDLKAPPAEVVRNEKPLPRPVVEKVARQLAASFSVDAISARVRETWRECPTMSEVLADAQAAKLRLQERLPDMPELPSLAEAREQWAARLADLPELPSLESMHRDLMARLPEMPELPSLDEMRSRAREQLAHTPSLDVIAQRARELLSEAVSERLVLQPA
ncbi:MAG: acyl-CoA desaturase [Acidobacteriota bacterium]